MFKLDNNFLSSLGLGSLPVDEKNKLLQAIYERLEMNVGMRLAERMTDTQLDEFESFIDNNDESGALRWLEANFPDYKQVVAEELEALKAEISQAAPQILAAAAQQTVSEPVVPPSLPQNQPSGQSLQQSAQPIPGQYNGDQVINQSVAQNSIHQPDQTHSTLPNQDSPVQAWPSQQPPPGPGN